MVTTAHTHPTGGQQEGPGQQGEGPEEAAGGWAWEGSWQVHLFCKSLDELQGAGGGGGGVGAPAPGGR